MKKFVYTIILSLVLSGPIFAETYQGKHGRYSSGTSKVAFCDQEWPAGIANSFCRKASPYFENGIEINDAWRPGGKKRFAIFKDVTVPIRSGTWGKQFGNGTFHAIAYSWSEAQKIVNELKGATTSNNAMRNSLNTNEKIAQAKQICKDLGFRKNSEKFADCALKMMSMQFNSTDKVAKSGGGTSQKVYIQNGNDYDLFDAMIDLGNSLRTGGSSSSSRSTGTNCRVVQRAYGAEMFCN